MTLGALEPKFWRAFVEAVGLPHLADAAFTEGDEGRKVVGEIEEVLRQRTRAEWVSAFTGLDVCCEPLLSIDETFDDPQVQYRGMELQPGAAGPLSQCASPLRLTDSVFEVRRPAPGYAQHTRELLAEVGYEEAAVDALAAEGAVR
jgi:crotonobetainyl-CoA:carnitine CoA-transferase CaiB-like acyl-CoA transferase